MPPMSCLLAKYNVWLHAVAAMGTAHLVCLSSALLWAESLGNALLSASDSTRNAAEQIGRAVHRPLDELSDHC